MNRGMAMYPMRHAMRMTGLTARQIRYYEDQGLIAPARSRGNHRLFSEDEIHTLSEIRRLLNLGLGMDGVRQRLVCRRDAQARESEPENSTDADQWFRRSANPISIYSHGRYEQLASVLKPRSMLLGSDYFEVDEGRCNEAGEENEDRVHPPAVCGHTRDNQDRGHTRS